MERNRLNIKLRDWVSCKEMMKITRVTDFIESALTKQMEMGSTRSKKRGQQMVKMNHRMASLDRAKSKRMKKEDRGMLWSKQREGCG